MGEGARPGVVGAGPFAGGAGRGGDPLRPSSFRRIALLAAVLLPACGGRDSGEIRVFAASSLTDVMETIARDYERTAGTKVRLNLAASSTLARQIVDGAPCDVFLSADEEWADYVERGRAPGHREDLLSNRLCLVGPRGFDGALFPSSFPPVPVLTGDAAVKSILLSGRGSLAMGDPTHVPAGRYAREDLTRMHVWDSIRDRIVPCDNVRGAIALIAGGEVDAAIVYRTDARALKGDVELVAYTFGQVPIRYPLLNLGRAGSGAASFVAHLRSPKARSVFEDAGFEVVGEGK